MDAHKKRIFIVLCGFAVVFSIYSWRLIDVQVVNHDKYAGMAARKPW